VSRLRANVHATRDLDTILHFGFDNDDPQLTANITAAGPALFTTHDRMGLGPWTNHLAALHPNVPHLASLGDDMVPITPGWDRLLVAAAGRAGMAYPELGRGPEHGRQPGIPEGIIIARPLIDALGWVCQPDLSHWFVDNVWRDIGAAAGCLAFVPEAIIRHMHPNVPGGDKPDATYTAAARSYDADLAAYQRWRLRRMRADVSAVRRVRDQAQHPV
jgi:hypothetical protein